MAIGFNLEDNTDYYNSDKVCTHPSGLTKRQRTILHNRIEKNRLIVRDRYGKRAYDKLVKVISEVLNNK